MLDFAYSLPAFRHPPFLHTKLRKINDICKYYAKIFADAGKKVRIFTKTAPKDTRCNNRAPWG